MFFTILPKAVEKEQKSFLDGNAEGNGLALTHLVIVSVSDSV